MKTLSATLLLPLFAASCASPDGASRAPIQPLTAWNDISVDYTASAAQKTWSAFETDHLAGSSDAMNTEFIQVETAFASLSIDQVDALLGSGRRGPWALVTDRASAMAAFEAVAPRDMTCQTITPAVNQPGHVLLANQVAYVERYDVTSNPTVALADPVVSIAQEGRLITVQGTSTGVGTADESVHITATIESHDLHQPIPTVDVALPGSPSLVTVQQPITTQQILNVEFDLAPDQALIVAMPETGKSETVSVGYLIARPLHAKPAQHDNPMRPLFKKVEADKAASGLLKPEAETPE